ncbi:unnamed protein product [Pocillopora meandrina]|uniref:Uncharacterized protein n=1 Tax=Pocillopora meandrina TaxID=46732 RepID=A0AAU9WE85_9CNID|nr:unnamed protein product [Pocillopora meandrina]
MEWKCWMSLLKRINSAMAFLKALKKKAVLAFVCISFLLSPLQLVEIKIRGSERWKIRRCTAGLRTTLQIICVNCMFLGLRMYLRRGYEKDVSIFIAKNAIVICLDLFEI